MERSDVRAQKEALAKTYGDLGWEVPRVVDALAASTDLYVDAIATAHVPRWSQGRVVLLESRFRSYAIGCQKVATRAGSFFAPASGVGIAMRNFVYRALTSRFLIGFFEKLVKDAATDFQLPEYVMKAGAQAPPWLAARSSHAAE